ncbi:Ribosomal large subunit pseudouridine synthase A [Maioricimonas rarisocia]|uniref:tRNA uridine(34) hydroxylase n=1 Tax=Maioricimonas rarisocia TaxID=2528026 RepID=A0A517ZG67_9PLAN|nr:sulfurtransferase [Maioricimonas rarisocia]QDU41461.1 Ribosomal large subunit pseudouridine synthase A [Maioricimonas rarisocia]
MASTTSPQSAAATTGRIVNIAAYRFVHLDRLEERRAHLKELTRSLRLKGTILLSEEGINLFVAGDRAGIDALLEDLRRDPLLADLEVKESLSDEQPFERMLVKIKKEIIAFGVEGIDPARRTSPKLPAKELREWLAKGRKLTLLDVRNDYEVEVGTFENAVPIGVDHFRDFPEAAEKLPEDLREQPVVMFCTGGIRCEKAGPMLEQAGFREVYQLEGGILKYFEECGGDFYQGSCFVFDKRVAVDPELKETDVTQCFACQAPLTPEDRQSPQYEPGVSCPHCWRTPEERMAKRCAERTAAIAEFTSPLPGRQPYVNYRPLSVPGRLDNVTLLEFLCGLHPHVPAEEWRESIDAGRVVRRRSPHRPPVGEVGRPEDYEPVAADRVVRSGERFFHVFPTTVEPDVAADIRVLFEDDWIVAVHKPAPLPMHPCGRYHRNTLEFILRQLFSPLKLRPAHRLDANTSGIVLLSKTRQVASRVQPQFERGEVTKTYLARVAGVPERESFRCEAAISSGPSQSGHRSVDADGLPAVTEFRLLETFNDGTSLLEVSPLTGRTNQIRVHLQHLGLPIVGDPVYGPGADGEAVQTLRADAPPMCLQAAAITIRHPQTGKTMTLEAPAPEWSRGWLAVVAQRRPQL